MTNKVLVIGCPGAGKSTFAKKLSKKLALPLYHLDNIWFRPDGTHIERDEFDRKLSELLAHEKWIIDGNYQRTLRKRIEAADTVYLLDIPTEVCIEGIKARRGKKRDDIPFICEKNDEEFLTRVRSFAKNELPEIYKLIRSCKGKRVYILKSRIEMDYFSDALSDAEIKT